MKLYFVIIVSLCSEVIAAVTYDGCKVYEVIPEIPNHQKVLELLHATSDFDFWSNYRTLNKAAIIMVKRNVLDKFSKLMKDHKFKHRELIPDVERISFFQEKYPRSYMVSVTNGSLPMNRYNTYKTIKAYVTKLQKLYSEKVDTYSIGRTIEGRDIWMVKFSKQDSPRNKPAILIDAGIHAREWIAPATALFIIHQLAEHCCNEVMLEEVDWYIVPLLNPDGYEFSQKVDRLWRKNRNKGKLCLGVDPNRNFDFHWMQGGSSGDECSETFAGKRPFSERETIALRDFVLQNRNIKLYITLHSFGSLILYPWNYSPVLPDNVQELSELAQNVSRAIKNVYDTEYIYGTSNNVLYQASGNSEDWMKGKAGIDLSYALELPGGGDTGFDVPESMIEQIGKETFCGIKVFWNHIAKKWGKSKKGGICYT